ncbi:uncharacterized protein Dana_GF22449, isoform B [Drosophila ananassae]|uniref:RING-type E3 ubiquitin transferase n=1 Tax=Drosophila ananassae TaxID=7217 RepID=A0A0P9BV27_DROAN|nr:uncharacterized protein LOC6505110 isoform X1 [Drosophila ananassae]KPU75371.1 uncharacterized protein Dana_GF22449, isoform B [Drosophila ananassae]
MADSTLESDPGQLKILGQLKTIEQINEQRRIFLKSTINEEGSPEENGKLENGNGNDKKEEEELEKNLKDLEEIPEKPEADKVEEKVEKVEKPQPPSSLSLNVKYATLPSPSVVTLRSPLSPPPKPPMLSRTRSIGSGDGRSPSINGGFTPESSSLLRQSLTEGVVIDTPTKSVTSSGTVAENSVEESSTATISARHYEGLIEELRCPGCAGAMKAPVLLCKSGHSVCEQCTRILLMCPLCKEPFTTSRSLTVEALCAKAHFRCGHASGGCQVRMPVVLLPWHEQQCIYKPMKCFMGRVWGECRWQGREVQWKEHLEEQHGDRLFRATTADLVWEMAIRRKPLTGYYVFQAHDEMFNFYEIHDRQRILFTMTCTSNRRDSKYNYAYEVTILHPDNEALSMTQKFPVHSEYDKDILLEGTCVSIPLTDLTRFVDQDKQILHYRVNVLEVKSPRRAKPPRQSLPPQPVDHDPTKIVGVNGKSVPTSMIITRTYKEAMGEIVAAETPTDGSSSTNLEEETPEIERKWGTPQLHFNRKYLRNTLNETANTPDQDELRPLASDVLRNGHGDDKLSLCSNSTSYTKKVSDSLRKSFRALKADIVEMRPFSKKSSKAAISSGPSSPVQANGN